MEKIPPKTHQLLRLSKMLSDLEIDLSEFNDGLASLSEYYFGSRYPGEGLFLELGKENAEKAIENVRLLRKRFEKWKIACTEISASK